MTAIVRTTCRLCDGPLVQVLDLGWTPLANALHSEPQTSVPMYPLALARCRSCGHFQLPVEVDARELFPPTYPYASGASASMRAHLDGVAELVAKRLPGNARVLEIGCNDGYLLDRMQDLGLSVVGVDPAAPMELRERHAVHSGRWGTMDTESVSALEQNRRQAECFGSNVGIPVGDLRGFDAIVGLNVFAHMANLRGAIEQAARALKPNGLLFMEVGYFGAMVEQNVFDTIYHEHLDYHTLGALVPFLERCGMWAFDAERIPIQGGSIRVLATPGRGETRYERLLGLLDAEKEMSAVHYYAAVLKNMEKLRDMADSFFVGYGCPAKATTLTSSCASTIRAYIDDNPMKAGKVAPDGVTPIWPNTVELDRWIGNSRTLTVLVFAWNMLDEIVPKIRNSPARCLREARILIPFPEPHYIEP